MHNGRNDSVPGDFCSAASGPDPTLVIFSPEEHRNNHRMESVYADLSPRLSTSTNPIGGQGRGINPLTEQTFAFPRPTLGPSSHTAHHGSPGYHVNEVSRWVPQLELPHIITQRVPTDHHYTQVSSAIHDQRACDFLGGQTAESFHRVSAQRNIQAAQRSSRSPTDYIQTSRVAPLPPEIGVFDVSPNRRDLKRPRNCHCPVPDCLSSFHRPQERNRHLLTHLPHWIHCPAPGCSWRGDRLSAFRKHWRSGHPSSGQALGEGQCKTYDPWPLIEKIVQGTLCIQAAKGIAMSKVKEKGIELDKWKLCENPWGSKAKKTRRQMTITCSSGCCTAVADPSHTRY